MAAVNASTPVFELVTDASGNWGCGAVLGKQWFQLEWAGLGQAQTYGIMAKEMYPVIVAAAV